MNDPGKSLDMLLSVAELRGRCWALARGWRSAQFGALATILHALGEAIELELATSTSPDVDARLASCELLEDARAFVRSACATRGVRVDSAPCAVDTALLKFADLLDRAENSLRGGPPDVQGSFELNGR